MVLSVKMVLNRAFLITLFIVSSLSLLAQPPGPPEGDCFGSDPMDECPIDGGVGALLIVGVGYGIKKVRESRIKSISTTN